MKRFWNVHGKTILAFLSLLVTNFVANLTITRDPIPHGWGWLTLGVTTLLGTLSVYSKRNATTVGQVVDAIERAEIELPQLQAILDHYLPNLSVPLTPPVMPPPNVTVTKPPMLQGLPPQPREAP